jgi:ElaB/YqjD/DUF883 family membrane-anchored ribosome-binding protein
MPQTPNVTQAVTDTFDAMSANGGRPDLAAEALALISEAEALLRRAGGLTSEAFGVAREDLVARMGVLRTKVDALAADALRRGRIARDSADRYVHDNPWQAIAIAGGVGVLVGALVCRR